MSRIPAALLRSIRNNIPMDELLTKKLMIPTKHREGYLRFLCPACSNMNTAINPRTNLARCFTCRQNFNTIDMVMTVRKCSFLDAVRFLTRR